MSEIKINQNFKMMKLETIVPYWRNPRNNTEAVKVVVKECLKDDADRNHDLCASIVDDCFKSEDYIEGRRAFMEKRKAAFKGK